VILKGVAVTVALLVAAVLAAHGTGAGGVRELVRWTARPSLLLFCAALVADGVRGGFVGWRRFEELLRGLALSHSVHLLAVLWLAVLLDGENLIERSSPVTALGGLLGYVSIFWCALRPRSPVVSIGLGWIWVVFMVSYWGRAVRMPVPFAFAVALLVLAMAVRVGAALVRRTARPDTAQLKGGAA
jgi:hypothetical protein